MSNQRCKEVEGKRFRFSNEEEYNEIAKMAKDLGWTIKGDLIGRKYVYFQDNGIAFATAGLEDGAVSITYLREIHARWIEGKEEPKAEKPKEPNGFYQYPKSEYREIKNEDGSITLIKEDRELKEAKDLIIMDNWWNVLPENQYSEIDLEQIARLMVEFKKAQSTSN